MQVCRCTRYLGIISSVFIFLSSLLLKSVPMAIVAAFILWCSNILFSMEDIKKRIIFMLFHITFFVFLLGRPVFQLVQNSFSWPYSTEALWFALNLVYISLFFMGASAMIYSRYLKSKKTSKTPQKEKSAGFESFFNMVSPNYIKGLRLITLALLAFCFLASFYVGLGKIQFSREHSYVDYYVLYKPSHNIIISNLADLLPYALCFFLATRPTKWKSFMVLGLFLVDSVPEFIVGMRSPIMLRAIFVFLYYFLRDITREENEKKWIGKFEKAAIVIAIPIIMSFLVLYSNIRENRPTSDFKAVGGVSHFFIQQGISFEVLGVGYENLYAIKSQGFKLFALGGFVNWFKFGFVGRQLFGTVALPSGNHMTNVTESHLLGHPLSYYHNPSGYVAGRGLGSSYLLETYYDFGYIGVIVFSILLGVLLIWMCKKFSEKKNIILNSLILISLTHIFYTPRDTATGWLTFIIKPQFLFVLFVCFLFAKLCIKAYDSKKVLIHEKTGLGRIYNNV